MKIYFKHCKLADKEHTTNKRQYAHTFHYNDGRICVANAFYILPIRLRLGILLHELGHLLGAIKELEADRLINKVYGISIKRINTKYGDNLETI